MQRYYKPIELARELGISASVLRHYEAQGAVPKAERAKNGYRLYTKLHLAYFHSIRAMVPGFGYSLTYEALRLIQHAKIDGALWLIGEEQAKLQEEKRAAERILKLLHNPSVIASAEQRMKQRMTIGEAAAVAQVQPSAIRHWEKEGLLMPERDAENGYRLYSPSHVRQIQLIGALRKSVYYLDRMKEIVQAVEHHNLDKATQAAKHALEKLNERNRNQFQGIRRLMELCAEAGLMKEKESEGDETER